MSRAEQEAEIETFLKTGDHDPAFRNWPGNHALERITNGDGALRQALFAEVESRVRDVKAAVAMPVRESDLPRWTRKKLEPMVNGLFRRDEHEPVLTLLSESVVFVTDDAIRQVIGGKAGLHTAWVLANMYTRHYAEIPISDKAPHIVGLSEDSTCYVSLAYFEDDDPFADFVAHEAAHVLHNVKRQTLGLTSTRRQEWLLPVAFRMRETFAYSCEAFSRIVERGGTKRERIELAMEIKSHSMPCDEYVDSGEYVRILEEAAESTNGWKVILKRCSEIAN
jgi:hypothetical protein